MTTEKQTKKPKDEAWRRFYSDESELEITPPPKPKTVKEQ